MRTSPRSKCPCFSGKAYAACCRPYHRGEALPEPEALMRSRYAAYALGKARYILETSGEGRSVDDPTWIEEVRRFSQGTRFTGLEILAVEPGDPVAWVTFRAHLEAAGQDVSFTERSRFERTERWRYVAGERVG
ncbi:MAG: zinc chelation protein SecC [Alphaproteobacteria bacterium]|nr:zinc chelation protein SecC [Alphaproteobacteria bacterium]